MFKGVPCPDYALRDKEYFKSGITNGAAWYALTGGMQDYNYVFTNCFEITVEMGCYKFPTSDKLPEFWNENKYSLLAYIEQVGRKGDFRITLCCQKSLKLAKKNVSSLD